MRTFLLSLITMMMLVTCINVQAIRDEYASEPALIEALVVQGFSSFMDKVGGDDGIHAGG